MTTTTTMTRAEMRKAITEERDVAKREDVELARAADEASARANRIQSELAEARHDAIRASGEREAVRRAHADHVSALEAQLREGAPAAVAVFRDEVVAVQRYALGFRTPSADERHVAELAGRVSGHEIEDALEAIDALFLTADNDRDAELGMQAIRTEYGL